MAHTTPPIEHHPAPNFTRGRSEQVPLGIVVHTTAGTWESALDWFGREESEVSAHYLVGLDGRIAGLVDERDTARHAGRVLDPTTSLVAGGIDPNLITVGIEFEDAGMPLDVRRPAAQYASGAQLIAATAARWEITLDREHVVGHREIFAAKDCPGNLDVERLVAEAEALSG